MLARMDLPNPELLVECRPAPNPRRVRIFLAEKGVSLATEQIDIMTGAHFRDHAARVGTHHVPALRLSDGRWLTETVAICRYIEALHPEPNLLGRDPLEAAEIEMWQRRMEFDLFLPIAAVLRHGNPKMAVLEAQCPEWAEASRPRVLEGLRRLDARLGASPFVAGPRFTIADITALVAVDFLRPSRIAVPADCRHLAAWRERTGSRPSAAA
jgi:glutathione S-transferase